MDEGPWLVLVSELTFDEVKVGGSIMHVSIELWRVVVIGLLGFVLPLGLGFVSSHDELVLDDTFGNGEIFVSTNDVFVNTKINNWIVLIIAWILLLVLVLVASAGVADWVRSETAINTGLNSSIVVARVIGGGLFSVILAPGKSEFSLSLGDVTLSGENLVIKTELWNEIILVETLWRFEARNELVSELGFGTGDMSLGVRDINVLSAEVWYEIVLWISLWGLEGSG